MESCAEMGGGRDPLQPAVLLPQGAGGFTEVCPERMAEIWHPGQLEALRDAPRAVSSLSPIPYV